MFVCMLVSDVYGDDDDGDGGWRRDGEVSGRWTARKRKKKT